MPPSHYSKLSLFFSSFKESPFDVIDALNLQYRGIEFNFLKRTKQVRFWVFVFSHIIMIMWFLLGFDSCQSQFEFVLVELPNFFQGKVSFNDLAFIYQDQYGKGMHYSAWVIYGFMFWGLSKYYDEKHGITKSRNFALTFAFVLLSIGTFETFWHYSFAIFQNQTWVIQWNYPQLKILVQNLLFFLLGFTMIFVMYVSGQLISLGKWNNVMYFWKPKTNFPSGFKLNLGNWTKIFLLLTLVSIFVWHNYGEYFPIEQLEVEVITDGGNVTWTNTPNFPQTVYTIETDLTDNVNAGEQFYVENDLLHGVNTLCKIFMTSIFYCMGRITNTDPKYGLNSSARAKKV